MENVRIIKRKGDKCLKALMDKKNVPRSKTFALLFLTTKKETDETGVY